MVKHRSSILFRNLVTGLLAVYLFYVLANLYFIPNCVSAPVQSPLFAHNGVRRPRVQSSQSSINIFMVGERSILDDDLLNSIKWVPAVLLLFFAFAFVRVELKRLFARLTLLPQRRYDYLSFCTLRI
jgi:hypothetical protein